jgi:hypothetical protein
MFTTHKGFFRRSEFRWLAFLATSSLARTGFARNGHDQTFGRRAPSGGTSAGAGPMHPSAAG